MIRLTAAGEVLLGHVRSTLGGFRQVRDEIEGLRGVVTGQVRRIAIEQGRVAGVDHDSGRLPAGAVLLAAGAWAGPRV